MHFIRVGTIVLLLGLAVALTACESAEATATPEPQVSFTEEQVRQATKLEEMRGHLRSSVENAQAGNFEMALVHAWHPYAKGFQSLEDGIRTMDSALAESAGQALQDIPTSVAGASDTATFESGAADANAVIDRLAAALLPADVQASVAFRAEVLAALLEHGADEYVESISNGVIHEAEEYQDGYGFYQNAKELWTEIEGAIKAADASAYEEIEEQFERLNEAFISVAPPSSPTSPNDVLTWVEEIVHELDEATEINATEATGLGDDAADELSDISHELDEVLTALQEGKISEAQDHYTSFDDAWFGIEDGVRAKSRDAYRAIEEAMTVVKNELIRPESPDVAKATASVEELNSVIDASLPGLR